MQTDPHIIKPPALIVYYGRAIFERGLSMAKAQKLPSGNWRCRATVTDDMGVKHTESFTAETARKAETLAKMWQEGMIEKRSKSYGPTLDEAITAYIETCRCSGMSPSTIRGYLSQQRTAYPLLSSRPISKITVQDIQRQINARSQTCSPKTLRNGVGLLSVVLKQNGIRLDLDTLRLPKREQREMVIPSDDQVRQLLEAVYDDDDMYIAIMLAAVMGLRRSEICALRWDDIITRGGVCVLSLTKSLVMDVDGTHVEKSPKTQAGARNLAIPSAVRDELMHRRNLRPRMVNISPNVITERYERLARRLDIPGRFHDLRHYHASVMLREGVPEKYIVADMGHASFDMVRRVYGHVMGEKQQQINALMDCHASAILESCHENCHAK